jgi:hypothetical protein
MNEIKDMTADIKLFMDKIVSLMSIYKNDNRAIKTTDAFKKISEDLDSLKKIQANLGLLTKMSTDPRQLETYSDGTVAAIEYHSDRPNLSFIDFGNRKINHQVHKAIYYVEEYLFALKSYKKNPNQYGVALLLAIEKLEKSLKEFYQSIKPTVFRQITKTLNLNKTSTPYKTKARQDLMTNKR